MNDGKSEINKFNKIAVVDAFITNASESIYIRLMFTLRSKTQYSPSYLASDEDFLENFQTENILTVTHSNIRFRFRGRNKVLILCARTF